MIRINKLILLLINLSLISCQKIIDIDLNEADSQYVIDATIKEGTHTAVLKITETIGYFDTVNPPEIYGANCYLLNSSNNISNFQEKTPGTYLIHNYQAIPDQVYNIHIEIDGNTISGSSYLPNPVTLDSVTYVYENPTIFSDGGYLIYAEFTDPAEEENFYRLRITKNGKLKDKPRQMVLFNDKFTNGNSIKMPYYLKRYELGDEIKLELISIDENVYRYYETLYDVTVNSGPNEAAPANPASNLSNNAIGYFCAFSSTSKTVIIQ